MSIKKGFPPSLLVALIALVGVVSFYAVRNRSHVNTQIQVSATNTTSQKTSVAKEGTGNKNVREGIPNYVGALLAGKSAPLLDFAQSDYKAALKSDTLIVLYFYANWCPICKAEFPMMQEAFNELTTTKVIGFRVNYNDDQTDNDEKNLAREFGVAYQHTKVFVKNGKRILKSPEGWDDKRYDIEINKARTQ